MQQNLNNEINKLSIPERILLVEDIWDSIANENEAFELSQSQKDELERRSHSYKSNPSQGRSWQEIKAEFLKES
jgi:putative addiction module component (TIGR02574 family)